MEEERGNGKGRVEKRRAFGWTRLIEDKKNYCLTYWVMVYVTLFSLTCLYFSEEDTFSGCPILGPLGFFFWAPFPTSAFSILILFDLAILPYF